MLKFHANRIPYTDLFASLCIASLPWGLKINSISIIIFLLISVSIIFSNRKNIIIPLKKICLSSLVFFVSLLWLFATSDLTSGMEYIIRILSAFLFPILFSILLGLKKINEKTLISIFFLSCVLRYILFIISVVEFELIFIFDYWLELFLQLNQLFNQKVIHTSFFSLHLGFCTLSAYYFAKTTANKFQRFWIIVAIISLLMSATLMAKMPLMATSLILLIWLIKDLGLKRKILLTASISLLVILTFFVPNPIKQEFHNYFRLFKGETVVDNFEYNQVGVPSNTKTWKKTNRLYIWNASIKIFKKNFLLGVGTGDVDNQLLEEYKIEGAKYFIKNPSNTHNQYLDYLVRFGIIGSILILLSAIFFFKIAIASNKEIYFAFLLLVGLCCFTENILNRQFGIVFFFFFNSLFLFNIKEKIQEKRNIL